MAVPAVPMQVLCFGVIGAANTLIHGALLAGLIEMRHWPIWAAHTLAFGVANVFSYAANSRWTFKATLSWQAYGRFLLSSLLSLALTLLISLAAQLYGLNYKAGFVWVVVLVPVFSFFLLKFWAFRR